MRKVDRIFLRATKETNKTKRRSRAVRKIIFKIIGGEPISNDRADYVERMNKKAARRNRFLADQLINN